VDNIIKLLWKRVDSSASAALEIVKNGQNLSLWSCCWFYCAAHSFSSNFSGSI